GTYVTAGEPATIWAGAPLPRDEEISWRRRTGAKGSYVSASFTREDPALRQLRETLLLAGALGTVVAALLGMLLASGMSRRLRRAAVVADRVAAGDHAARIDAAGGDEIARLGHAVDQMSNALATRLAREQRFAGDVAHELRTPLTGLTSAAELLDDSRPAQIVRERVGALRGLVAELLELAQLDADENGPARLTALPLEPWLREFAAAHPSAPALEFERPAVALADRRRLERVVGNLLDNAVRHGRPPLVVQVTGTLIEVRDDGPGFPAELLRDGPQRFWKGAADRAGGSGLGLAIAAGHAAMLGAELRFANRPGGGAVAWLGPLAVAPAPAPASAPDAASAAAAW
ncbi:MAG TPA: HAMP domain-containing sensor histidine kinase, partial [Conexibacter sp.]|nr:HAMP domain-containing sensor histidine kinase [Conexibacter sp.]